VDWYVQAKKGRNAEYKKKKKKKTEKLDVFEAQE
jgi:hypothetical protein